jgi:hypothetical protein
MKMLSFKATIKKFAQQGEKTGWTYIDIPVTIAQVLKPGNKKSFRVKGKLDEHAISKVALIPIGNGAFIMAVNATMRKGIRKNVGATIEVQLTIDTAEIKPPAELIKCLKEEPKALEQYNAIAKSHQLYFTRWIESAKTDETKARRIAQAVTALAAGKDYGAMLRSLQKERAAQLKNF